MVPEAKTDWGTFYDLLYEGLTSTRRPVVDPEEVLRVVRLMEDVRQDAAARCHVVAGIHE